ncbi:MAG: AI-2E family transporter [Bacteroidota bacterium]|nr:AI-2E family transporter [Bacteroidota bacterium]MDP3145308.1 AI-2E family transporter [Bacteroidota bacterium]MDP3557623.1 AI-2E family transporter [Bacteroidota bacterium]
MNQILKENTNNTSTNYSPFLKKLLILFLVIAGLYYAKAFLIPLSIGAVIATLFLPFCKWMESKKVYRGAAVFICVFLLLIAFAALASLIGWQIASIATDFELIRLRAISGILETQEYIFNNFGITIEKQSQFMQTSQPSVKGIIPFMAGSFASIFTSAILTIVYIFGLLYYRGHIKEFLLKLTPLPQRIKMQIVIYDVAQVSQQYLIGLSKMILCLWIMYGIGFSILGIKNAIFFAILCGVLEIIPFIGNITGTIITLLIAAVQGASFPVLIGVIGTYGGVQLIQGWILEPLIVGSQVKINPLFTIIALVLGELVWGIPGIFLAIPLIAMVKIVCDHVESFRPYGFLIGEIDNGNGELGLIKRIVKFFKLKSTKQA